MGMRGPLFALALAVGRADHETIRLVSHSARLIECLNSTPERGLLMPAMRAQIARCIAAQGKVQGRIDRLLAGGKRIALHRGYSTLQLW